MSIQEKILTVGAYPPPMGGAELNQQMLVKGLAGQGYDMHVLPIVESPHPHHDEHAFTIYPAVVSPYPRLAQWLLSTNRPLDVLDERSPEKGTTVEERVAGTIMHAHAMKIDRLVKGHKADVTIISPLWHTRDTSTHGLTLGIAQGSDVRTIKDTDRFAIEALKKCDHIVAISPSLKERMVQLGVDVPISIIFPAIAPEFSRPPISTEERIKRRETFGIQVSDIVFGHVSTHQPVKQVGDIVDAFIAIQSNEQMNKSAKLILVGEGPDTRMLYQRVRDNGLENKILFVGNVKNESLPELYDLFDAFILSSKSEGLAKVVLEAQARSLPCIISNIPGPTDIIFNTINGLTYTSGNSEELARRMTDFATNPDLQRELRVGSSQFGTSLLRVEDWVKSHDAIIQSLIHNH